MQKQNLGKFKSVASLAIFGVMAMVGVFGLQTPAKAVDANQVLGQLDANGLPIFTQLDKNSAAASINDYGFEYPVGIAVDSVGHRLFVADTKNHRVLVYNLDIHNNLTDYTAEFVLGQNDFSSGLSNKGGGASTSSLSSPVAVVFDGNELLYVADSGNNRIMIFDLSTIDNGEDALSVLGQSNFTSHENNRGLSPAGAGSLFHPNGLALDNDRHLLFISDTSNSRVMVYDVTFISNGENAVNVLGKSGLDVSEVGGTAMNKLFEPRGIAYNSNNKNLAIADNQNSRVVIYDLNSIDNGEDAINVLGQIDFSAREQNRGGAVNAGTLSAPYAVAYNTADNFLYVVDYNNNRVLVYDVTAITNGENAVNVLGQINFSGRAGNQGVASQATAATLYLLQGAYFDNANGKLYVADGFNNRVLVFKLLKLPTTVLADGQVTIAYNQTINQAVNGQGTVRYSVVGNLPNGLSLNVETGSITGIPTEGGHFTFIIKATDTFADNSTFSDSKTFDIVIVNSIILPSKILSSGLVNGVYSQTINPATNADPLGVVSYTVTDGNLPPGITLVNGITGELAGTPTATGTYSFTITATDGFTSDSEVFTIQVLTLDLPKTLLPSGLTNELYGQSLNPAINTQGDVTYTVTAGILPDNFSIDNSGKISGTSQVAGVYNFTVTAEDALHNSDSEDFTITIDGNNFSLPFIPLENGLAGSAYDQTIPKAINAVGNVTYSIGAGLPAGLTFNVADRHISGIPAQVQVAQDFTFDVTATDEANNTDTETFTIHIEPALELLVANLPSQIVGSVYSQTIPVVIHSRGSVSYSVVAGNLPGGLAFNPGTREIHGTPNVVGTFTFTIQAADALPGITYTDTQDYTISISNPFTLPVTVLPNTVVNGTFYIQTLNAATNAQGTVSYAVTAGALPAGFSLTGRIIQGNPTVAGTSNFTITATDTWLTGEHFTTTQNYSITINPIPVVPPPQGGNGGGGGGGGGGGSPAFNAPVGGFSVAVISVVAGTNQVNLALNGGTATRMAIANTPDFAGASQVIYRTSTVHTLTAGNGIKTIYARFFDSSGTASVVVSATTTFTSTPVSVAPTPITPEVLGVKITRLDELVAKLKAGQTNSEVMEMQNELKKLGYFAKTWKSTKFYGAMTKAAVKKYLADKNKVPVVAKTLDELVATLKLGQKNDLVKQMQTELKKLKFFPASLVATGYYGPATRTAVNKYLASK